MGIEKIPGTDIVPGIPKTITCYSARDLIRGRERYQGVGVAVSTSVAAGSVGAGSVGVPTAVGAALSAGLAGWTTTARAVRLPPVTSRGEMMVTRDPTANWSARSAGRILASALSRKV